MLAQYFIIEAAVVSEVYTLQQKDITLLLFFQTVKVSDLSNSVPVIFLFVEMNARHILEKYVDHTHCFEAESSSSQVTSYPLGQGLLSWSSQSFITPTSTTSYQAYY